MPPSPGEGRNRGALKKKEREERSYVSTFGIADDSKNWGRGVPPRAHPDQGGDGAHARCLQSDGTRGVLEGPRLQSSGRWSPSREDATGSGSQINPKRGLRAPAVWKETERRAEGDARPTRRPPEPLATLACTSRGRLMNAVPMETRPCAAGLRTWPRLATGPLQAQRS